MVHRNKDGLEPERRRTIRDERGRLGRPRQPGRGEPPRVPAGGEVPDREGAGGLNRREERGPKGAGGEDQERRPRTLQRPRRGLAGGARKPLRVQDVGGLPLGAVLRRTKKAGLYTRPSLHCQGTFGGAGIDELSRERRQREVLRIHLPRTR